MKQSIVCFSCVLVFLVTACGGITTGTQEKAPVRPNFLIILADDLGFSDIGCYGGEIATPHLDRLAARGVKFRQFYNAARCCPSRATLLTGQYPHRAGMGRMVAHSGGELEVGPYQGWLEKDSVNTLAEWLRPAGYQSYMSGKWHVGEYRGNWPLDRGFDRYFGLISGASSYYEILDLKDRERVMLLENERFTPPDSGFYATTAYTDYAVDRIAEHGTTRGEQPFLLYLAYTAPHWPLHAPESTVEKYLGRYEGGWDSLREVRYARQLELGVVREEGTPLSGPPEKLPNSFETADPEIDWDRRMAVYAAMVEEMDKGIGLVMEELQRQGLAENTIVMFMSDNGACAEGVAGRKLDDPMTVAGEKGSYVAYREPWAYAGSTPFRYYKKWTHEGVVATPFIYYDPRQPENAGQWIDTPAHLIDLLPTVLNTAGVADRSAQLPLPGRDLRNMLSGKEEAERPIFWEHFQRRAVRMGKWKLLAEPDGEWELYDMVNDRSETQDLAGRYPEKVKELIALYDEWAKEQGV